MGDAGEHDGAAGRYCARHGRRQIEQGAEKQIGKEQLRPRVAQIGMRQTVRLDHADARAHPVLPRIVGRYCHGNRIVVGGLDLHPQRLGGGDGEDAGAGADIQHAPWAAAFDEVIECEQAASRACMMGRPEGLARVDLDGEAGAWDAAPVVAAMHQESSGTHGRALFLRDPHPVLVGERLDPPGPKPIAPKRRLLDQRRERGRARLHSIMGRHFGAASAFIEQRDRKRGRTHRRFQRGGDPFGQLGRRLDAGLVKDGRGG